MLGLSDRYLDDFDKIHRCTPENLKPIVHYALAWGIDDDGYRSDFISDAPPQLKRNLKLVVGEFEEELDEWLAGPEAARDIFSAAYLAFSNMRLASDEII